MKVPCHSLLLVLAAVASTCTPLHSTEPPTAPILRLEAEMHTGSIRHIATDASGRLALTASDDKTARLWEIPSGRLLRIFRPPISGGNEGQVYSCALSPNGAIAALGGNMGMEWDRQWSCYLFDTATGKPLRRFQGLPELTSVIAFSPTGRFLAAGLGETGGLRVWEVATGRLIGQEAYGHDCYGLDWHGDHLVTSSIDGQIRLYHLTEQGLQRIKTAATAKGRSPFDVRFSPDGSRLALGFQDSLTLEIRSASDLSVLEIPKVSGLTSGDLSAVAWSSDGQTLAAGGRALDAKTGLIPLRLWKRGGMGSVSDLTLSPNTIMEISAHPAGGFLYSSAAPAWGWVSANSSPMANVTHTSPIGDFRDFTTESRLALSADGASISFTLDPSTQRPMLFTLSERRLSELPAASPLPVSLRRARHDGLPITDWKDHVMPKLRGKPLLAVPNEAARSLAIAPDGSSFLIGSDYALQRFSSKGEVLWFVPAISSVQAVNFSADGQLAVAALGDGTIRWYRADVGRELLVLCPLADRKRWVLWTNDYEVRERARLGFSPLDQNGEAVVVSLDATGPSARAGIKLGDHVVRLAGKDISASSQIIDWVLAQKPGTKVPITVMRQGKRLEFNITLDRHPRDLETLRGVYYDCSPGAEDLIGWHLNRGRDQAADFFPIARFRAIYYRPDVAQRVLGTRDAAEALRQANAALGRANDPPTRISEVLSRISPPVVELETGGLFAEAVLPAQATSLDLHYRIRQTGQEKAQRVEIRANGRPVVSGLPAPEDGKSAAATIPLPPGFEGEISVIASHSLASSDAATLRLRRGDSPGGTPGHLPRLFVIAVGVAELAMNQGPTVTPGKSDGAGAKARFNNLEFAATDARKVAAFLSSRKGQTFATVEARLLVNEQATTAAVRQALREIGAKTELGDVLVFFFSGHGNHDPKNGKFHLVTHDTDPIHEGETAFSGEELSNLLGQVKASVVVALDACHSGAVLGMQMGAKYKAPPLDISGLANQLSSAEYGLVVLSSSTPDQFSYEDPEAGGGLFTQAFLEGLGGKAANHGVVTCASLMTWLDHRIPELANGGSPTAGSATLQTPVTVMPKGVPDFVLTRP